MGYYSKNPYEQPEPPRCVSCDEFKVSVMVRHYSFWECHNPACEECPPKYQVVECSMCGEEYTYGEFCQNCTDGAAVGVPEKTAGHWLDISTGTHKRLSVLKNGVYCRLCQDTIKYSEMKPLGKDNDTVDMLCPGCDSVLVEGE